MLEGIQPEISGFPVLLLLKPFLRSKMEIKAAARPSQVVRRQRVFPSGASAHIAVDTILRAQTVVSMGLNYKKWDNLPDYSSSSPSSSEEDNTTETGRTSKRYARQKSKIAASLRLQAMAAADEGRPRGVLVAVAWDSHCGEW